jgi:iron complex outermembrane receptor protein
MAKRTHKNWERLCFQATRRNILPMAIAAALPAVSLLPQSVWAQTTELEGITVTGIRVGIENAIETKRQMTSIVEAISAEDIGKLPDTSIAESISRLPGLTSQRAEGRASAISLRGTDPGFTTALMNGREQVSTGDNRSVEFDQYPSELLSSVVVYKTPDSGVMAQGLAGTIDLHTIRPLQYSGDAIVLNMRGEQNSNDDLGANSDDTGYRASFSFIDQYMDGRFGIAFGYAHLDSPMATRGFGTYEPWNPSGGGGTTDCPGGTAGGCFFNPGVAPGQFATNGMKVRADMGSTVRDGFMATLEFAPNDSYSSVLDLYYSTMEQTDNARSLEINLGGFPAPCCVPGPFPDGTIFGYSDTTIENDTVVAGTLNNITPLARNFLFTTDDEILAGGWRNEFRLSDVWSLVADVSYSRATRDQLQPEINAQLGPDLVFDTGTFELRGNDDMPSLSFPLDYAAPTQVFVGPTIYGSGYTKKPHVEDELTSYRLDAIRESEVGWFAGTAFGVNYSYRTKDKSSPESSLSTIGGGSVQVANQFLLRPTDLGYADAGRALALDVNGVLAEYFNPITFGDPNTLPYLAGKYWYVAEDVATAYVRGDLNHEISDSVTLAGNVGLQVVYTDQSSSSYFVAYPFTPNQVVERVGDGKSYEDVLPQINFAFLLPNDKAVRVGIARELARARMDQLKATDESGYDFNTGLPSGNGGNPLLDPWRAWALDISFEKYFAERGGYVSLAGFYKDLETYIFTQTDPNHDFSDLLAATPPELFADPDSIQTTGNFSRPENGSGGYLWGLELATAIRFDTFSEALDGFGAILSYSYTESDITIPGAVSSVANDNIPLPGLSEDVWNATLYYEKHGFGVRVATRYRSEYIGEVTNFANERGLRFVDDDMITDAQLSYAFGEGMLEGLQLLFQVNNVTNEPYIAYSVNKSRILDFQEYGTQYLVGANYRF